MRGYQTPTLCRVFSEKEEVYEKDCCTHTMSDNRNHEMSKGEDLIPLGNLYEIDSIRKDSFEHLVFTVYGHM